MTDPASPIEQPTVSVIIPLYNKERYIRRALDSVRNQTTPDWNVIVVDDGSTDGGTEHVAEYPDPRVRLIRQANAGPGAARNRGLAESRSPLVSFLDADDEWLPTFLEHSVTCLREHPECSLSVCACLVGPDRTSNADHWRQRGVTEGPWRMPASAGPRAATWMVNYLFSGAIVCRREVVQALGGYYAKHHCTYGEDGYLWAQAALRHTIYRSLEPLVWYHTEASDLGYFGRSTVCPPPPVLLDPQPLREQCPPSHRQVLEGHLAYLALVAAERHWQAGDLETARWAIRTFPRMRRLGWPYWRLRARLLAPRFFGRGGS
ncbi:MAG: glycosyltransferase family 2 protein [Phycisphaerae bacterium]|nr:glycosyltransferase family 2 protein [Phycisphaerae bacterium]